MDARQVLKKAWTSILALKMGLMKAYQVGTFGVVGEVNGDVEATVNEMEAVAVPYLEGA